jgi:hypothetical protein
MQRKCRGKTEEKQRKNRGKTEEKQRKNRGMVSRGDAEGAEN